MAGLFLVNRQDSGVTMVPDWFIDQFLPEANGEFVKVYLILLRQASGEGGLSVSRLADVLNNTEKDVLRALKYWEKMKLLKLEYGADGALRGIILQPGPDGEAAAAAETAAALDQGQAPGPAEGQPEGVFPGRRGDGTEPKAAGAEPAAGNAPDAEKRPRPDLQILKEDEAFCQLLYLAGRYTQKNLTARDCDVLANLYSTVGMPAELLEYLIEYCVSGGHKSMRYIETVALDWNVRGIRTVEQAKAETAAGGKNTYAVLKAFGLGGRNPAAGERQMIDQWFHDYGFSVDMVLEACDKTMRTIHQPSFEYADRILRDWKEKGIREKEDISRLDPKPAEAKGGKGGARKRNADREAAKNTNRFHNFTERDYDCDELLKQINGI